MAEIKIVNAHVINSGKPNKEYKRISDKLSNLKSPAYLEVTYSDVEDDQSGYDEALKKLKLEGHKVEISSQYKEAGIGVRGETVYTAFVYPK